MKIRNSIQMLIPTVQYGNVTLISEVAADTVTDLGRLEEAQKSLGIEGQKNSTEVVEEVVLRLALDEMKNMKKEIDKLSLSNFQWEGQKSRA